MIAAIKANWEEPYAKLHAWVKHSKEKFGRDSQMAKANADWLMGFIHQNFQGRPNYRGGRYTAGYWTMTMHAGYRHDYRGAAQRPQGRGIFRQRHYPGLGFGPPIDPPASTLWVGLDHLQITNGQALNIKYFPPDHHATGLCRHH